MTKETVARKFGVNVMRHERPMKRGKRRSYYTAFRGGNGTGEPVVEVARAYTLAALARKLAKGGEGKPLIEIR